MIKEGIQNPPSDFRERLDPVGMKHLGSEIAAEEAPRGAIETRVDVKLIIGEDVDGGWELGTVGEDGTVLNKKLVGKRWIKHGDFRLGRRSDSDDGTIFCMQITCARFMFT